MKSSQFYFFFSPADEKSFSTELLKLHPNVRFLKEFKDGSPVFQSLEFSESGRLYIVNFEEDDDELKSGVCSNALEKVRHRKSLRIEKCKIEDDVMFSGTILFGSREDLPDDLEGIRFYKNARKAAKKISTDHICHIDFHPLRLCDIQVASAYIVGQGTHDWLKSHDLTILRDRSVEVYYLTREIVERRTSKDQGESLSLENGR